MRTNLLSLEDYTFVDENQKIFTTNYGISPGERQVVYNIYNRLTGENKRASSCGRCWTAVKQKVQSVYLKQKAGLN